VRGLEPGGLRRGAELGAELAEGEVLAAVLDEAEGSGIPECGGSTVAHNDLVALGQREELVEAGTNAADEIFYGSLAVGGAHDLRACGTQIVELRLTDLGRAAAESSVSGKEFGGDSDLGHAEDSIPRKPNPYRRVVVKRNAVNETYSQTVGL
jgi:hypothetical protein